ncbi:hypothetical protein KC19_8G136500 [Ceratodon purpureus]|uniref:Uncharacterized protein n=1 Tax=Ceratodon purpureus TaxID=3225 RepID=A0A8T0H335_CERPU|nr:hypothetical protein KC19_8G136500 [Ceratodon purpureus]
MANIPEGHRRSVAANIWQRFAMNLLTIHRWRPGSPSLLQWLETQCAVGADWSVFSNGLENLLEPIWWSVAWRGGALIRGLGIEGSAGRGTIGQAAQWFVQLGCMFQSE